MGQDIGIGMTQESDLGRDMNPAKDQLSSWAELMDIVSNSRPNQ